MILKVGRTASITALLDTKIVSTSMKTGTVMIKQAGVIGHVVLLPTQSIAAVAVIKRSIVRHVHIETVAKSTDVAIDHAHAHHERKTSLTMMATPMVTENQNLARAVSTGAKKISATDHGTRIVSETDVTAKIAKKITTMSTIVRRTGRKRRTRSAGVVVIVKQKKTVATTMMINTAHHDGAVRTEIEMNAAEKIATGRANVLWKTM